MNALKSSPNTLLYKIFAIVLLSLLVGACSGTKLLSKGDKLKIKGTARVIGTEGKYWLTKNLILDEEKLEASSLLDKQELKLARKDVVEIRYNNHLKGMYKGATIGAGIGAGLGLLGGLGDPTIPLALGTSFGLTGGIIGLIGGYSETYRFSNKAANSSSNYHGKDHYRNRFYAGIEIRGAWGNTPNSERRNTLGSLTSLSTTSVVYEAGVTLNPTLLLGIRIGNLYQDTTQREQFIEENFVDTYLLASYFPDGKGRFVRFGIGGIFYNYSNWYSGYLDHSDDGKHLITEPPPDYRDNFSKAGIAGLVGLGYAYWVGKHWNITMSADLSNYFLTNENTSHVLSFNIGTYWY